MPDYDALERLKRLYEMFNPPTEPTTVEPVAQPPIPMPPGVLPEIPQPPPPGSTSEPVAGPPVLPESVPEVPTAPPRPPEEAVLPEGPLDFAPYVPEKRLAMELEEAREVEPVPAGPVTPERMEARMQRLEKVLGVKGKAEEEQAAATGRILGAAQERITEAEVDWDRRLREQEEERKRFTAKSNELRDEFQALPTKSDVWEKASTGKKIAGLVAIFLSGFFNPRGTNRAMEMLNQIIERDIRAKELAIRKKRGEIQDVDNLLSRNIQLTGSYERGKALTIAQEWDTAEAMMKIEAQKFGAIGASAQREIDAIGARMKGDETIQGQMNFERQQDERERAQEREEKLRGYAISTTRRGQTLDYNARMAAIGAKFRADIEAGQLAAEQAEKTGTFYGVHDEVKRDPQTGKEYHTEPLGVSRFVGDPKINMREEQAALTKLGNHRVEMGKLKVMLEHADTAYDGWFSDLKFIKPELKERIDNQLIIVGYAAARAAEPGGRLSKEDFEYWRDAHGGGVPGWFQKADPLKTLGDRIGGADRKMSGFFTDHGLGKNRATTYNKTFQEDEELFKAEFKPEAPKTEIEELSKKAQGPFHAAGVVEPVKPKRGRWETERAAGIRESAVAKKAAQDLVTIAKQGYLYPPEKWMRSPDEKRAAQKAAVQELKNIAKGHGAGAKYAEKMLETAGLPFLEVGKPEEKIQVVPQAPKERYK